MAKMRATLRKVAQVTPPPSPKNGEDVKGHSEWSTRLRNHSIPTVVKVPNGRRAKIVRIKKESPVFHHNGDLNLSRSSTPSPVCDASRARTRQTNGEGLNYWPRRSARLIGIPAEEISDQHEKNNGSINVDQEENKQEPLHEEKEDPVCGTNHCHERLAPEEPQDQCKNCKQQTNKQQTKGRTLEALLVESQRFMHYPSGRGSGTCRNGRSTYNSRDIRPPPQTSPRITPVAEEQHEPATTPLPMIHDRLTVDQVQFSFEIVPSGTSWYQTFLRDEEFHRNPNAPLPGDPPIGPAPFLLPYEMSLEAILKSNQTVRKNNSSRGRARGAKKSVPLSFRPIISTRLQMQSAARQSQLAAAASSSAKASALNRNADGCQRHSRRKQPWFNMPRKSPRCHASTMAILCSKSDTESDAVASTTATATGTTTTKTRTTAEESQLPKDEVAKTSIPPPPDNYLVQVLEEMLTQGLEKRPVNPVRKRGRPRKRPLPTDEQCNPPTQLMESPLADLLATPLERIEDIVDERMVLPDDGDHCMFNDSDTVYPPNCWITDHRRDNSSLPTGLDHLSEMFADLDSHSGSRSSSVYETASEIGSTSTSTGTCDSRRKVWRNAGGNNHRRKRRCNMTGWPRSKKRRPLQLSVINVEDDLNLTGNLSCDEDDDEGPPNIMLSPIREESTLLVDGSSPNPSQQQTSPRSSSSGATKSFVSKPFQFQRKTLRFVGKRILRPAAQRHAPQRLEYWPCFPTESSSGRRRKRKT